MTPLPPSNKSTQVTEADVIDHLGLRLARAYALFKREMLKGFHAAGFNDLTALHLLILPKVKTTGTSMAELVEDLGMPKQSISRSVKEMVKAGYIELQPDPADGRAKIVRFTEKSTALIETAKSIKVAFQRRVSTQLGPSNLSTLMTLLEQMEREFDSP